MHNARAYIDVAHSLLDTLGIENPKLMTDYRRIDAGAEQRQTAARDAEDRRQTAARDADADRTRHAENKAFAANFNGDVRMIALTYGRPCRTSQSYSALGHIMIWWYFCSSPQLSSFGFRNGALIDKTEY